MKEKANEQVAKEENDRAASLVSPVNHAKASLTAALATKVGHQDRDEKIGTDAAEAVAGAQATTDASESVTL